MRRLPLTPHRYVTVLRLFAQLNSTKASVGIDDISFGTPVNFNVVLDRELSSNTVAGLSLVFVVKRAIAVKVLVSFIVMANCTSTSHYLCLAMVVSNVASGQGSPV